MGDPHNPERYGEEWPEHRISAWMPILETLKEFVVFSGGWAWHFLSPPGHIEYKHAHDHKDVDLMVPKANVGIVMGLLKALGFEKVTTKYDRLPSEEEFRRYEKNTVVESAPVGVPTSAVVRLTIDFFVKDVPVLDVPGGWQVVDPATLLTYYSNIHSSDKAWAVQAAAKLVEAGEPVLHSPKLCLPQDYKFLRGQAMTSMYRQVYGGIKAT